MQSAGGASLSVVGDSDLGRHDSAAMGVNTLSQASPRPPDVPPLALPSSDGQRQQYNSPRRISPRPPLSPSSARDPLSARGKGSRAEPGAAAATGGSPRFGSPKEKRSTRKSRKHSQARQDRKSASSPADVVAAMVGHSPAPSSSSRHQQHSQNPLLRNHSPVRARSGDRRRTAGSAPSGYISHILEAEERPASRTRSSCSHLEGSSWQQGKTEEESLALVQQLFGGVAAHAAGTLPMAVPMTEAGSVNQSYTMNSPMSPSGSILATPRSGTPLVPRRLYRGSQGEESSYRDGGRRSSSYSYSSGCGHQRTPSFRTGVDHPPGPLCSARTLSSTTTRTGHRRGSNYTSTHLSLDESWEVGGIPMASPIPAASPSPLPHARLSRNTAASSNVPTELLESEAVMDCCESEADSTCGRVEELCDKASTLLLEMRGLMATASSPGEGGAVVEIDSIASTAVPSLEDVSQKQSSKWGTKARSSPLPSQLPPTALLNRNGSGERPSDGQNKGSAPDETVEELKRRVAQLENNLRCQQQQQHQQQPLPMVMPVATAPAWLTANASCEADRLQKRFEDFQSQRELAHWAGSIHRREDGIATVPRPPQPPQTSRTWQPPLLPQASASYICPPMATMPNMPPPPPSMSASPSMSGFPGPWAASSDSVWPEESILRGVSAPPLHPSSSSSTHASFVGAPIKVAPLKSAASCSSLPGSRAASPQPQMRMVSGGLSLAALTASPTPCRSSRSVAAAESPQHQFRSIHGGMQQPPQVTPKSVPGLPLPPQQLPPSSQPLQSARSASSLLNSSALGVSPPVAGHVPRMAVMGTPPSSARAMTPTAQAWPFMSSHQPAPWQFSGPALTSRT
eukprot:TRINITY_DN121099_c0_g1_i1.p1 TRINITY_DN121099_c0_g1~~TRINITY_DN121099_c0_g1_i1.p1  ORF type:complete len:855 (+),score=167.62 TRINITY_DN121099_c0_g1_i1:136-2700(+)